MEKNILLIRFLIFSVLLLIFSYFVFRIIVRHDYSNKQKLSPLSYLLETLVFALHANFAYIFLPVGWPGLPKLPDNHTILFFSILLITFGFFILLIAWFNLGTKESFGQDKNSLRITGLYKYSRNPQLVGFGFFLLGFVIMYISWYSIAWFMVLSEEEFLSQKYEQVYKDYCKTVPRIFRYKSFLR